MATLRQSVTFVLFGILSACTSVDEAPASDRPPYADDGEILGAGSGGKADGAGAIVTARTRTSGYIGAKEYGAMCFDTFYELEVTYENHALPWGVTVELVSAMSGTEWSPDDVNNTYYTDYSVWRYEQRAAASAVGPWQWRATRGEANYVGGGSYDAMHFALRMTYPDGSVRWDNGGSAWGYYEVVPPPAPCDEAWTPYVSTTPDTWQTPGVRVVQRW